jgi:hypothetical protein
VTSKTKIARRFGILEKRRELLEVEYGIPYGALGRISHALPPRTHARFRLARILIEKRKPGF